MQLDLFRIKVFPRSAQGSLFDAELDPSQTLEQAVLDRATSRPRRGVSWHIGNVERLDDNGVYFRLGKRSKATLQLIDDATGNFTEAEFESAPYTHALLDVRLEVCALARHSGLAPTAAGIARRLASVLNESPTAHKLNLRFVVGPISNPDEFLAILGTAFAIRSFTFTFQRRNPIDVDADFIKPFEQLVGETNGSAGQATIRGFDLEPAPLEQIARSAAATGDDAKARLLSDPESAPIVRTLHGDNATVGVDSLDTREQRIEALNRVRAEYRRVRGTNG